MRKLWKMNRRNFLRAGGVSLALPLLDVMMDKNGKAFGQAQSDKNKIRLLFGGWPHGIMQNIWSFNKALAPLLPYRKDLSILENLKNNVNTPRATHGHYITNEVSAIYQHLGHWSGLMTGYGKYPRAPTGYGTLNVSVDQALAKQRNQSVIALGKHTTDSRAGYLDSFANTLSYDQNGRRYLASGNVQSDYDRYIAGIDPNRPGTEAGSRRLLGKSVLDLLKSERATIERKISTNDKKVISSYYEELRELEVRIDEVATPKPVTLSCDKGTKPSTNSLNYATFSNITVDLIGILFACDTAHNISHTFTSHHGQSSYGSAGAAGSHGNHHEAVKKNWREGDRTFDSLYNIDKLHVNSIARLAAKLNSARDYDGKTVLENSAIVYMSECRHRHNRNNIPCIVLGKAGGALKTGADHNVNGKTQLDLFHTIASAIGLNLSTFGGKTNSTISQLL